LRDPQCGVDERDPLAGAPCLTASLVHPDGTRVLLFDRLRDGLNAQDAFPNTEFNDLINPPATTSINVATAPYVGRDFPHLPLSDLKNKLSTGTWRLEVTSRLTGAPVDAIRITQFAVILDKPVLGTGLGEPAADLGTASFRLWTWDGRNPVSRQQW